MSRMIPNQRNHRPKGFRWSIAFCCNSPDNGCPLGVVENIKIGIGRGNFVYGTDYLDEHELTLTGQPIRFCWQLNDRPYRFKIGRKTFRCVGPTYGVGNWCWDSCMVSQQTVRDVTTICSKRNWQAEEGSDILWNWWKKWQRAAVGTQQ